MCKFSHTSKILDKKLLYLAAGEEVEKQAVIFVQKSSNRNAQKSNRFTLPQIGKHLEVIQRARISGLKRIAQVVVLSRPEF